MCERVSNRSSKKIDKLIKGPSVGHVNENTCFELQYDPYLISVACSYTELSILEKIWAIR